ncbi:MAG: 50S ribosomal protein L9, partial [Anaerolineae bacterium]
MEVLLVKDVESLGKAGDIQDVANGYARNFLFPRGLAVAATPGAIRQAKERRKAEARQDARILREAQDVAERLDGLVVTFQALAGETDRLYGSITNADIAEALEKESGLEVDRRKISMEEPLKELGTHAV